MSAGISYTWAEGLQGFGPTTTTNPVPTQLYYSDGGAASGVTLTNPLPVAPQSVFNSTNFSVDGRGRQRVVQPLRIFQSSFQSATALAEIAGEWDYAGTPAVGSSYVEMATAADAIQTRRYFASQMGCTTVATMSAVINAGVAYTDEEIYIGLFDANDGFYFKFSAASGWEINYRKGGVDATPPVAQASWEVDQLNGSGPSAITLLETARNTFFIEVDWSGAGQATFGVIIGRQSYIAHTIKFGNEAGITPETDRISLPIRAEVVGTAPELRVFAAALEIDGGRALPLPQKSVTYARSAVVAVNDAAEIPVLALRPEIGGRSRIAIEPLRVQTSITKRGDLIHWRLYRYFGSDMSGVLTGASFAGVASTGAVAEVDEASTGITVGGGSYELLGSWYGGDFDAQPLQTYLACGITPASDYDCLVLTARRIGATGSAEEVVASITWREVE